MEQRDCCAYGRKLYPSVLLLLLAVPVFAQVNDSLFIAARLRKLSLEELMDIEIISVSKHAEKLNQASSAVQVISQQDIRSSGARTLAEALRLAPNLQVAQANSSQWAISSRGFNNVLANKLLVLIDGRTIYTPLYAGVFWDVQNLLLEDVERIEVVSGPGGTLWGANAVNGVINIITKHSGETKGLYAEAASGYGLPAAGSMRYGGALGPKVNYRVYGTGFKMGSTFLTNGKKSKDDWPMLQGGFRVDWAASAKNRVSVQSNIYHAKPNPDSGDTSAIANGDNIVARWTHRSGERSDLQLQGYYDHTWRDFGNGFTEDLKTYDLDFQSRHEVGSRHTITVGANTRLMEHKVTNLPLFQFRPAHKQLYLYGLFVQYELMVVPGKLRLAAGLKAEHNSYTGFEYQPNTRLTWTVDSRQTIWAAVSHAVRTPARIDRDFYLDLAPGLSLIAGTQTFMAEQLSAYEIGWRMQRSEHLSLSLAGFYNLYDDLRSTEPGEPPLNIPLTFGNGAKGHGIGAELSGAWQANEWWSIRAGYTYVKNALSTKAGSKDLNAGGAENNDPESQVLLQSTMALPGEVEIGTVVRYVSKLPRPAVTEYAAVDIRIGWKITPQVEISIVGQNLQAKRHLEFIPSSPSAREIPRCVYGKLICRI